LEEIANAKGRCKGKPQDSSYRSSFALKID